MIGAGLRLALAALAQTPTLSPRDTQLIIGFPADLQAATTELLVRHAFNGQTYFEHRFGRRATLAWSRDTRSPPPQLAQILSESGLRLLADAPTADSNRFPLISGLGERLPERFQSLIVAEMLAALDTSPYPRAPLAGAWRFDSLADTVTALRDAAFAHLVTDLDTRGGGVPIVVFNPVAWVRSTAVAVPLDSAFRSLGGGGGGELRAVDAARRATAALRDGDSLRFVAREVPPVGLKVFWVRAGRGGPGGEDTTTVGVGSPSLVARRVRARPGLAGPSWSFVAIDAVSIQLTALKRAEHGNARVVRLMEQSGESTTATLTFGPRMARVRIADLLEQPLRTLALSPSGRSITLAVRPREIVTLLVEEAR